MDSIINGTWESCWMLWWNTISIFMACNSMPRFQLLLGLPTIISEIDGDISGFPLSRISYCVSLYNQHIGRMCLWYGKDQLSLYTFILISDHSLNEYAYGVIEIDPHIFFYLKKQYFTHFFYTCFEEFLFAETNKPLAKGQLHLYYKH